MAERQMRAFGTTMRYAFAGSVIFGMTSMVGQLNQLQQQMGLIAALAAPSGLQGTSSGWLGRMQDEIAEKSVDARIGVTEFNDATVNFLSTVQNAKVSDVPDIIAQIGISARLSQTPTEELTKTLTTMNLAAGRQNNLKTLTNMTEEWFHLISTAPGAITAAPQIAQQLGPLSAVLMGLGPSTPEQIMGLTLGSLKFGATPSVALRGLQYFTQSLMQPPSKEGAEAQKKAGFTPERLAKEGPAKFFLAFLDYVRKLGGNPTDKGIARLTTLAAAGDVSGEEYLNPNAKIPGLSPAALKFLKTSIGRIHGIRTAAVLLRQMDPNGPMPTINELIKEFDDINKGVGEHADDLKESADKYRAETPLQGAALALEAVRSAISRDLAPGLNVLAQGISEAAEMLTGNPNLRKGVLGGAAAAGGGFLLWRMLRSKKLPGMGGLGGLLGKGFAGAQIAQSLASPGGQAPMGTASDPLFVIVLYQLGGGMPGIPGMRRGPGGTGGMSRRSNWPSPTSTTGRGAGFARAAPWLAFSGPLAVAAAVLATGGDTRQQPRITADWWRKTGVKQFPALGELMMSKPGSAMREQFKGIFEKGLNPETNLPRLERDFKRILKDPSGMGLSSPVFKDTMAAMQNSWLGGGRAGGDKSEVQVEIRIKNPAGKTKRIKPVKVPTQFANGRMPSTRGRRKTIRTEDIFPDWITGGGKRGD